MRTEKEVIIEIARCEEEKKNHKAVTADWRMYNDRVWTLKWVLKTEEQNES